MLFGGGSAPVAPSSGGADDVESTPVTGGGVSLFSSATGGGGGATSSSSSGLGSFSMPSWLRNPLTAGVEEVEGDIDPCEQCHLSRQQRIVGFLACFTLGTAISVMSSFLVLNPSKFALAYSLGNVLSVLSTGFLVGPKTQCKHACAPVRVWAFIFFLCALAATLVSALAFKKALLTLFFLIIQVCAGLWYSASYVPYGRQMLQSCVTSCLGRATSSVG